MLLSDMGAQVIKVEQPGIGDYMRSTPPTKEGRSPAHATVNRNKLSIGIDLKSPMGKQVMRELLHGAEVFVEGFRPGAIKKLGFSFEDVRRINPNIVYCSISAYGQRSKFSSMPGHDINFQAMAGTLAYHEKPALPQLQLGDMVSGMFAAVAILGAMVRRKGAVFVDIPIVQSMLSWMVIPVSAYLATGEVPGEGHSLLFGSTPYYNIYRTLDNKYMAVAAVEQEFWRNLVRELGVPKLEQKRFGSKKERDEVARTLKRVFATESRDHWAERLMFRDTCATPVLTIEEALDSDWARAASMLREVGRGGTVLNTPVSSRPRARSAPFTPAPFLGEQTGRIMKSLGYSKAEVDRLRKLGAIG